VLQCAGAMYVAACVAVCVAVRVAVCGAVCVVTPTPNRMLCFDTRDPVQVQCVL